MTNITTLAIHPDESVAHVQRLFSQLPLTERYPENYQSGDWRNTYRASRVIPALVVYCERTNGKGEPIQTVITDVLADLMHLVDRLKEQDSDGFEISFRSLADFAERRYQEEVAGE